MSRWAWASGTTSICAWFVAGFFTRALISYVSRRTWVWRQQRAWKRWIATDDDDE